jgi:hypothetical protein
VRRRTGRRFRARGAVERSTLYRDRQCLCGRQRTLRQPVRQRLAVEQLHDEERRAVVLADVVQRTDVRVGQLRDRARFAIEARAELRVRGQRGRQDLDGDGPVEPRVAGLVDFAHAARANGAEDFVRTEACASGQGHGPTLILVEEPLADPKENGVTRSRHD